MPNIRGLFDTSKYEAGIKKLDIRDEIFELQPLDTPFIIILSKLSKAKAVDTEFAWFEDDLLGNYTQLNMAGNAAAGILQLIVDDATIFQEYDILKVLRTAEVLLVLSIDSDTLITVKRGWGTTAAATINDNDYLYKLGSAMQEGFTAPESLVTAKAKKSNFVQIFSKTVMITETAEKVATYGGNRRNFERNKKGRELRREIEAQFLWGEPKEDLTGAQPRRQTGGIYYFLTIGNSPSLNMNGAALTETAWEGFIKDVFAYGGNDRFAFMGPSPASQISQFASGKQRVEAGKTIKYGVAVNTYHSIMGDVHIVIDRHFSGPNADKVLILDVDELVYRYLVDSDFKLALNIQPKDAHYIKDEYTATIGLEAKLSKLHGYIYGIL